MNEKFLKPYNPVETEQRIYELWEKSGFFNPDNLPADSQIAAKMASRSPSSCRRRM